MSGNLESLRPTVSQRSIISRSNVLNIIIYFHVLLVFQVYVLGPVYQGLYSTASGIGERYILVFPLVIISAFYVPIFSRPSDLAVALLAITPVVPAFCFYTIHGGSFIYVFTVFLGFLTFAFCRRIPIRIATNLEVRMPSLLAILIFILTIVIFVVLGNFRVNSLSEILLDLYGVRTKVTENNTTPILNYVQTWVYAVIVPFLFIYFFVSKNWIMLIAMLAILFLFFLVLTGKSIIINPFILLAIYLSLKVGHGFGKLFRFIIGVICVSTVAYLWLGSIFLAVVLVRRSLFVPPMLNHHYHDLFSEIGFVYYSHSILSFLSDYPFQQSYQTLIGMFVFGSSLAHANTGIFGTGFMHFGYFGIIAFCVIMGLLSSFADSREISVHNPRFAATIVALPTSTIFTSADLFSGMLTNGYIIALILLIVCGQTRNAIK